MRIITLNANGIRSAERKDFFNWMQQQDADIICIQETKAQLYQFNSDPFCPANYHCLYHEAEKRLQRRGYLLQKTAGQNYLRHRLGKKHRLAHRLSNNQPCL